jgi:hypothetical protein
LRPNVRRTAANTFRELNSTSDFKTQDAQALIYLSPASSWAYAFLRE